MAEQIPDARLVEFAGDDHVPFTGDFEPAMDEMEEFLTGTRQARPARPGAGHRPVHRHRRLHAPRRGCRRSTLAGAAIERHDEVTRRQLDRYRGHEVKTLGDGFLATFDGPARGIECACAIRDGVSPLGLEVRAGLHTGECELHQEDVRGMAVNIGARVGAVAEANEVLVSSTVKDLVVGADLEFAEPGRARAEGRSGHVAPVCGERCLVQVELGH